MEQLIFFAVIIIFSIIESVARSRKKRMGGQLPPPQDWESDEPERDWSREPTTATYDAEPSYDEVQLGGESPSNEGARRAGSEGMIPSDIWEEIAGLARTRMEQLEKPAPPQPTAPPPRRAGGITRAGGVTPPGRAPTPPRVPAQHRVHRAHAGYGTDPSSRARSAQDGLDPLARTVSLDIASVRRQLRLGGRHALRQAVILQEILGPPASMRPEPFAGPSSEP